MTRCVDLAMSVCLYIFSFWDIDLEILHKPFSRWETAHLPKLPISADIQTDRSKSTSCIENFFIWRNICTKSGKVWYPRKLCRQWTYCSDQATKAYDFHTNWPKKKSSSWIENYLIDEICSRNWHEIQTEYKKIFF